MPIHFEDLDVVSEAAGLRSALIVPCNLCPAVTVAVRENRPFMRFFRSPVKSAPFEEYLEALRSRLSEKGVSTNKMDKSPIHFPYQEIAQRHFLFPALHTTIVTLV